MTRDHILDEIRSTAKANDGVPLGWRRFKTETGIKQSDFEKHWARWNDAVCEAGFSANQLTLSYTKEEIIAAYARLAIELQKLPTEADIRHKARCDPEFPSERAFRKRGSKTALVALLREHCSGRNEHEDVIRWCEAYTPRVSEDPEESRPTESVIGFVYLIRSGRFYKIGMTNAAGRREYELSIQLPETPKTIHIIRTDDPAGIEAYWHNRFADKRKGGEWFDLSSSDVAAFKRRKFM